MTLGEVEHRDRSIAVARRLGDRGRLLVVHGVGGNRRDEAVAAARDGLDEGRIAGLVAERLPQLRHGLRQRVVGDVGAGPERVEQRLFRHQRAGVVEQMEQQVEELGREVERAPVLEHAVGGAIDDERAEAVNG